MEAIWRPYGGHMEAWRRGKVGGNYENLGEAEIGIFLGSPRGPKNNLCALRAPKNKQKAP